jgi:type I restriction enzyme M protein
MVRLSLVNMYLHGFADPHIFEYDTLTSQERWNEYADVILANPPFMSPKGGIKPHNRFSVQSKRSEVLFVDYMAEHLTPSGRAGIIVPEGIIFQSQTAYKQLRKMLVEEYLVAVVSLPAGVFNPYSGVKTSILILDKLLAKKTNTIAFFKIENDGFGLGAQRREIDKNDLPAATDFLKSWLQSIRSTSSTAPIPSTLNCLIVEKAKVAANGEYNLSGERYREGGISTSTFPSVELGEICELVRGVVFAKEDEVSEGGVKVLRANNINKDRSELNLDDVKQVSPKHDFSDEKKLKKDDIFICLASGSKDHIGKVALIKEDTDFYFGGFMGAIRVKPGRLHAGYLLKQLTTGHFNDFLREQIAGANINNLSAGLLYRFQIPLPPLEVQKEIVAEIEGYQKVIDGARAVLDHYRPHIPIHPDWPMVELGEVLTLQRGYDLPKQKWENGPYPIVGSNGIIGFHAHYKEVGPGVVTGRSGTIGKVHFIDFDYYWPHNTALFVKDFKGNDPKYLKLLLEAIDLKSLGERTAAVPSLDRKNAHRIKVPLPPVSEQQAIVAEIEAEQALVAANRELIARFEKKIQATLARVWGEEA